MGGAEALSDIFGERKPNLCCGVYVMEKKLSKEKLGNLLKAALSGLIKRDKTTSSSTCIRCNVGKKFLKL